MIIDGFVDDDNLSRQLPNISAYSGERNQLNKPMQLRTEKNMLHSCENCLYSLFNCNQREKCGLYHVLWEEQVLGLDVIAY